jgi:pyridoxine/pyridoxamine 5'-phosphate oxidase
MEKSDVLAFIKTKIHTVVSTCGSNQQPEAALVGFGETDQLELIFGTFRTSKKYKNLQENSRAAFVIGWDEDYITVQYEGIVRELEPEEWEKYLSIYHHKVPSAAHYRTNPDQTYFLVTPTWIRYTDASGDEEVITEFSFLN